MSLRINEGYIITDSIHIGEYEFVLGVSQHSTNDFVTWRCSNGDYYYWDHYHNDLFSAEKDLMERAADKVFSVAARKCGFTEGRYLCFEEDCDEQVALRELMDKKLFKAPVNDRFPPGQYEKVIDASIQAYHPDYWNFRKTHLLKALENGGNVRKKEKERER